MECPLAFLEYLTTLTMATKEREDKVFGYDLESWKRRENGLKVGWKK